MSPPNASVRRQNPQALRFPGVTLFYQLYPGVHGRDADRGIANVHYAIYIEDRLWQTGETGADGSVSVPLPDGTTSFDIRIFGQRTTIEVVDAVAALTQPPGMGDMDGTATHANLVGVAQRLTMLGYMDGPAAGQNTLNRTLDKAILDYQVNEGFTPDGVLDPDEITRLTRRAGV